MEKTDAKKIEPKFDEEQAYFELCQIFAEAIQTQNFTNIETRISNWKSKYPIDEFLSPYIIAKIKRILSKEYLEYLLGNQLATKILNDKKKQEKAFDELKDIIETAKKEKDFNKAQSQISAWRKSHSLYSFDRFYRSKVCKLISTEYVASITETEKRDAAVESFKTLKSNAKNYDSKKLQEEVDNWIKEFPAKDFHFDFNKEISNLVAESLELTTTKLNEETAVSELSDFVEASSKESSEAISLDSISTILAKYDTDRFSDTAKNKISELTVQATVLASAISKEVKEDELLIEDVSEPVQEVEPSSKNSEIPEVETESSNLRESEIISSEEIECIPTILSTPKQKNAYLEFRDILDKNSHDTTALLDWIYKYRTVEFSDFPKEQILTDYMSSGYVIPKKLNYDFKTLEDKTASISFDDYSNINDIRETTVSNYFSMMFYNHNTITSYVQDGIESAYIMSKQAKAIDLVNDEVENDELFTSFEPVHPLEIQEEKEEIEPFIF